MKVLVKKYLFPFALLFILVLGSTISIWFVPSYARIFNVYYFSKFGGGILIASFLFWLFFIYKWWLDLNIKQIGRYLVLFMVLPLPLSIILNFSCTKLLYAYYNSGIYINYYKKRQGVSGIGADQKKATFAYCKLVDYSATYILVLEQDKELIFAFVNADGLSYDTFDSSSSATLASYFEKIDDAYVPDKGIYELGVYDVKKGTHNITIPHASPYKLVIFDRKPLLTPKRFTLGELSYPKLFEERYTRDLYLSATKAVQEKSCKGTKIVSKDFFLNDFIFIPEHKINLHEKNDTILYLYSKHANVTGYTKTRLLNIQFGFSDNTHETLGHIKYKEVLNKSSGQTLTFYMRKGMQTEPYKQPLLPEISPEEFNKTLPAKESLNALDIAYLNRSRSTFFVDSPLRLKEISIYFNNSIPPDFVDDFVDIAKNLEPAIKHVVSFEVSNK